MNRVQTVQEWLRDKESVAAREIQSIFRLAKDCNKNDRWVESQLVAKEYGLLLALRYASGDAAWYLGEKLEIVRSVIVQIRAKGENQ